MKTPNPDRTQSPPFYRLYIPVVSPEAEAAMAKALRERSQRTRKQRDRTRESGIT